MFKFIPIKPKTTLKQDAFRVELLAGLRKSGKKLESQFQRTTQTWQGNRPTFIPEIKLSASQGTLNLALTGNKEGVNKWFWLNDGTRVRRAVMSRDWKSKSVPGVLDVGRGRGRMVFVSKKIKLPGIKARKWSKIILKTFRPMFKAEMQVAMERGAKRSGHGL